MTLARFVVVPITAALLLAVGVARPQHNWDMIGYVAAAYYQDGYRGSDLLERTYGEVKAEVNERSFERLTAGDYRATVATDPRALEQHVPFYSIRVAYIELIRQLRHVGLTYTRSTYVISAVFSALSILLLFRIMVAAGVDILVLPVIVVFTGFVDLARLSSPDAITTFLALACALAVMRNSALSLVFAALMPLARTDFILLSFLVACYEFYRGKKFASIAALAASVLILAIVNRTNAAYGWLTIFNFTLLGKTPYPAELVPSAEWQRYARRYASAAHALIVHSHFVLYALASYGLLKIGRSVWKSAEAAALVILPLAFVLLHLALFPAYLYRFFVFAAALACVWLLAQLKSVSGTAPASATG